MMVGGPQRRAGNQWTRVYFPSEFYQGTETSVAGNDISMMFVRRSRNKVDIKRLHKIFSWTSLDFIRRPLPPLGPSKDCHANHLLICKVWCSRAKTWKPKKLEAGGKLNALHSHKPFGYITILKPHNHTHTLIFYDILTVPRWSTYYLSPIS